MDSHRFIEMDANDDETLTMRLWRYQDDPNPMVCVFPGTVEDYLTMVTGAIGMDTALAVGEAFVQVPTDPDLA